MGRKSYDDPHRISSKAGNYVITSQHDYEVEPNFEVVHSLKEALDKCADQDEVFVLGGQQIFELALPLANKLVLTHVHGEFKGDTFFPEFSKENFHEVDRKEYQVSNETPYPLSIITYIRK